MLYSGPRRIEPTYPFPHNTEVYEYEYRQGRDFVRLRIHRGRGLFFREQEPSSCSSLIRILPMEDLWWVSSDLEDWEIYLQSSLEEKQVCDWWAAWVLELRTWIGRTGSRTYPILPPNFSLGRNLGFLPGRELLVQSFFSELLLILPI